MIEKKKGDTSFQGVPKIQVKINFKYFLEVSLNENTMYFFAIVKPLIWNGSTQPFKLEKLNRYITDKQMIDKIPIRLEDLGQIIGLFPLHYTIRGRDIYVITPFSS